MEHYLAVKKEGVLPLWQHGCTWKLLCQSEKDSYQMASPIHMWNLMNKIEKRHGYTEETDCYQRRGVRDWMKEVMGLAKKHVCTTHRHRQ